MNEWLTPVVEAYKHHFGESKKPIVWEVGSRDGHDGVELASRIYDGASTIFWKHAEVVLVEPNPDQVAVIKKNYPLATVHEFAISDEAGTAEFTVYHGDIGTVGSSSLNPDWKPGVENHKITVEVKRLEDIVGSDEIDIMKIDTEGFSIQVLAGLGDKIRQVKVYHIETESWHKTDQYVKDIMEEAGYQLYDEREQYAGMPDMTFYRL